MKNSHKKTSIGKKLVQAAIEIIAENEGRIGRAELLAALKEKLPDDCNDFDTVRDGRPKWKIHLDTYSSPKYAGEFFEKGNREWSLTEEGWDWWNSKRKTALPPEPKDIFTPSDSELTDADTEDEVANYILNKEPPKGEKKGKWFEHTVAALLRGMGYEYVHVTKQSWDGGVDVVAYKDDLGIVEPRLKVQVKHYTKEQKVNDDAVLRLANVVHKGEVGMCVTSSSFSRGAESVALTSDKHLLLVDLGRFAQLWVKRREDMTQDDRDRIPVSTDNKKRKGENASN